jgi:hypothetical protein
VTTACPPVLKTAHPNKKNYYHPAFFKNKQAMSKISSVTVFTEVVAMISSFHRNSEKNKQTNMIIERKIIMRTYQFAQNNHKK